MRVHKPVESEEQLLAIHSDKESLVVRAAAGAGKTRVLVARFIKHVVEDGLQPEQILTITFTKKAAAEMKRRIVDGLSSAGLSEQAQSAETGPIQTIHSFCERLLRECSVEAGIDPEFEILDETEGNLLLSAVIQRTLGRSEMHPYAKQLIRLIAGKRSFGSQSGESQVEGFVKNALSALRNTQFSLASVQEMVSDPASLQTKWRDLILQDLPHEVQDAVRSSGGVPLKIALIEASRRFKIKKIEWLPSKSDSPELEATSEKAGFENSFGLLWLVAESWAELLAEMKRRQAVDFTDLESAAVRLLAENEPVRDRLKHQYKVVLIDESQDLSPIQYQLLESLGIDIGMYVGDSQQSIYRFRGANVGLFLEMQSRTETLNLTRNYRSDTGILHFVDDYFGQLWDENYLAMADPELSSRILDEDRYFGVEYWPLKRNDLHAVAQQVSQLQSEGIDLSGVAILVRDASTAMNVMAHLSRLEVPARIVGGSEMFYARMEIRDVSNVLFYLTQPQDQYSLIATLRSPFVDLSMDALVLISSGKLSLEDAQQSEFISAADKEKIEEFLKWSDRATKFVDRRPVWDILGSLFAETPFLPALARRPGGTQMIANVRKLLRIAIESPGVGVLEFAMKIREVQSMRHREGDEPALDEREKAVNIMTYHKAKGLEFPVVILASLEKNQTGAMKELEIHADSGMVTLKVGTANHVLHAWNSHQRKREEQLESLRLLYVGMTRARNRLIFLMPEGAPKAAHSTSLQQFLSPAEAPTKGVLVRDLK